MKIIIGSDHGGFKHKEAIKKHLEERFKNIEIVDMGTNNEESVDYPDYAKKVSEEVKNTGSKGILICGTGIGMSITANKIKGIRAALCHDEYTAKMARAHNNANILCMGGRVISEDTAKKIADIFLDEEFSEEERHHRRVDKVDALDDEC